jgi:hypothetical protein
MKKLISNKNIFFLLLFLSSLSAYSQDLIVTNEGDSLNCKITKVKQDYIYFTFKHKEEIRSTLLPINQVKNYQYNFYPTAIVPAEKVVGREVYPRIRLALTGGWGYRIAKLADNVSGDFKQYINDLRSGTQYGGDINYYFSEQVGLGLKYNVYQSKNEIGSIYVVQPNGSTQYGKMSDNIIIDFIGPSISTRLLNEKKKNALLLNLAIGYLGYMDNAVLINNYTFKGNTVGMVWDIGYDVGISENWAIGFQFSYLIGTLTQIQLSDGTQTRTIKLEKDEYENLSRIDLSVGLRLNF